MDGTGALDFALISNLRTLLWMVAGLVILGALLSWFDKRSGLEWKKKVVPLLETNANAAGIYFGLRFLGCCILISNILS